MGKFLLKIVTLALISIVVVSPYESYSQSCDSSASIVLKAGKNVPFVATLIDNSSSRFQDYGDTSLTTIQAYTWTNNSNGVPLYNGRTIMKFDLRNVVIPANAINITARLYLFADLNAPDGVAGQPTYGTSNTGLLQKVTSPWQLATTNFNTQPTVSIQDEKILPQSTSATQNYTVDITSFVKEWMNAPDSNYGMLLRMQTENNPYNSLLFKSATAPDNLKPEIIISYSIPQPDAEQAVVYGDLSSNFKSLVMDNGGTDDSGKNNIQAFTWTDNSHGNPNYNGRTLLWYNVSTIPSNSVILSARIYFYANLNAGDGVAGQPTYGTNNVGLLQKVVSSWQFDTTDYNHQPPVTTNKQKILPQSTSTAQNYSVLITDFVQSWVDKPDSNFGMLLRMQTENNPYNSLLFTSSVAPQNKQTKIVICYKAALPVVLQNFQGSISNFVSKLSWTTYNEINFAASVVEKSYDGSSFKAIGTVAGKGPNAVNEYRFTDADLAAHSTKVYYRLKLVDIDGHSTYSKVLMLTYQYKDSDVALFPNPSRDYVQMNFTSNEEGGSNLRIIDMLGKTVLRQPIHLNKGANSITVNGLGKLQKGLYTVQISLNGTYINKKVIIN